MSPTKEQQIHYGRAWAIGASRDDQIDGSPARGHVAKHVASNRVMRCVKTGCDAEVDDCGLFCALHLWTLDHPVLRDAAIFGNVVVL
jgi:hypothetical protein